MNNESKILKQIRLLGKGEEVSFIATIEANYPDKDYVDVRDQLGTLYTEVRKRAALKDHKNGIIITPTTDSTVIVSRIGESDELYISMFSDVDSIVIDGGLNEGLVKVKELTEKLNNLEQDINNLKTAFNSWVIVPSDGGAALKTTTSTLGKFIVEQNDEIGNTKRKNKTLMKSRGILLDDNGDLQINVQREGGLIVSGLQIGDVTLQNQYSIISGEKGEVKEAPLLGVGINSYLDDDDLSSLLREVRVNLRDDGQTVKYAGFNNDGKLVISAGYGDN